MEELKIPMLGDKFPEIEILTTHGMKKFPEDYKGKWFVLFSHPGDFTPVCTTEFVEFSERNEEFKALNAELVGLSVDQVFSHMKWAEWIEDNFKVKVPFPIVADELGRMASRLGMLHKAKGTNTVRAVYIVDDKGIIRLMLFYPQEAGRNVDEILRILKALQVSDKNGVAMPANWPENRHLGSKVLLPPPASEELATKRLADVKANNWESKDWWFSYKNL